MDAASPEQELEAPKSLAAAIADRLREMIIHDEIAPGTRLQERVFSARLNASRTPLRDATKILAREGLVVLTPNHGAQVANFTLGEIRDMLFVYSELDGLVGRLACERATTLEIENIARLVDHIEQTAAVVDRRAYFEANQAFHLAMAAAAHNQPLLEAHRILNLRLYRTRYLAIMSLGPATWTGQASDHAKLLQALRARKSEAMETMIKQHMLRAWEFIEKSGVMAPEPGKGTAVSTREHAKAEC